MNELNYPKYTDNADISVINENFKAVATAIQASEAHEASKQNPHGVTKEQLGLGNVLNVKQASKAEVDILATTKSEVVFGTYNFAFNDLTLDPQARIAYAFVNLGFRPAAVEIYSERGEQVQYVFGANECYRTYGGMAIDGFPMKGSYGTIGLKSTYNTESDWSRMVTVNHIEIAENGFYIRDAISARNTETWSLATYSYLTNGTHFYKAYKYAKIK